MQYTMQGRGRPNVRRQRRRTRMLSISWRDLPVSMLAWLVAVTVALGGAQGATTEKVTSFQQFYGLSRDQAQAGWPVQFRAVVLCYDAGWNQLYVHDGHDTAYFSPQAFRTRPETGQSIEITGTTTVIQGNNAFTNLNLTVLGPGTIPAAKALDLPNLIRDFGQWIETSGRVRVVDTSLDRLTLVLHARNQSGVIYVMGSLGTNNFRDLLDCKVRIRGIIAGKTVPGKGASIIVFVPRFDEIKILEKSAANTGSMPVVPIGDLLDRELGSWTNRRVRINGLVASYQPGSSLMVKDPTGAVRAQVIQQTPAPANARVDVYGFLMVSSNETYLSDAYFEVASPPSQGSTARSAPELPARRANLPDLLTNVADILKLRRADASQRIPVRLRGVITYADAGWRNGFLQDRGGGIYFDLAQKGVRSGQWVELTGVTGAGGFAPEVIETSVQVLGTTNLPPAIKVELTDVADGHLDAQWIELDGVVRQVGSRDGHVSLSLMTRKGRFAALIPDLLDQPELPTHLIDALVSVKGACTSELNDRRQVRGITLNVPRLDLVRVLEPAPENPFLIEATPIASVATFDPDRLAGRRVKVSGQVTLRIPGEGFVLQDATGGIRIQASQTNEVQIGDVLDVLGFPSLREFSPGLEEALFRRTGTGVAPPALKITAAQILQHGTNDSQVVQLLARLVQSVSRSVNPQLVLQDGPIIFTARLETPVSGQEVPALQSGSRIRLTGVCSIQGNQQREPYAFHVLLRRPKDLELLESPPWWTLRHTLTLAGGMLLVIITALAWIALLRRRVRVQTEVIRQKLEVEAALEARYRELFENANDLLFTTDLQSRCLSVNHAVEQFFGLSRAQALGKPIADFVVAEHQSLILEHTSRLMSGTGADRFEVNVRRADGQVAVLDFRLRVIEEGGRQAGIQVTARDITEQKKTQAELLRTSHFAGMAEVATGILHNVGNVLNSVNVSTTLVNERIRKSKTLDLHRAAMMLRDHTADLAAYLTLDPKGQLLPSYFIRVAEYLVGERTQLLAELESLTENVAHIKEIVAQQQSYAKVLGAIESLLPVDLMEDAFRMQAEALNRHHVEVVRAYQETPRISVDKHKVLQILLNLLSNAKHAMTERNANPEKRLILGVARNGPDFISLTISDTGVGIPPENLTRIFQHGFTTKKDGHGFGLHLGAVAAKEMGGALKVFSEGAGHGARFVLELPVTQKRTGPSEESKLAYQARSVNRT